MGKRYGYARVSGVGQTLEAQEEELKAHGAEVIYRDKVSGTTLDRPEFTKLLKLLQPGDTLIVTKLDRFSRSVGQAADLLTSLIDRGITVDVCMLGVLSNDSCHKLLRNTLLSFAQFERDMIFQRTQEGKALARAKNPDYKEGRKNLELPANFRELLEKTQTGEATVTDVCAELGVSRGTWYNWIRRSK